MVQPSPCANRLNRQEERDDLAYGTPQKQIRAKRERGRNYTVVASGALGEKAPRHFVRS